jgi:uncharacterized membrane protein YqjE
MRFRNPAGYPGLRANLAAFVGSATRFLESRLSLASQEAKAVVMRLVVLVACAVGALLLLGLGYVLLVVFAIVGIAHLVHVSWMWIALVVALLHFAAALFCLVLARGQLKGPFFRETTEVLKEDTQWLKNLDRNQASRS